MQVGMHVDVKEQFGMETAECVELWLVVGVDAVSVESIRLFCIRVEQITDSELGRPMRPHMRRREAKTFLILVYLQ